MTVEYCHLFVGTRQPSALERNSKHKKTNVSHTIFQHFYIESVKFCSSHNFIKLSFLNQLGDLFSHKVTLGLLSAILSSLLVTKAVSHEAMQPESGFLNILYTVLPKFIFPMLPLLLRSFWVFKGLYFLGRDRKSDPAGWVLNSSSLLHILPLNFSVYLSIQEGYHKLSVTPLACRTGEIKGYL